MEEEASSSMLSNAKIEITNQETSDSFDSHYNNNNHLFHINKRPRLIENNNNINVAKFKGVVPQQNGHWGAQIYANHQRIWLGTFKSEKEAAMAYDSAAIKLRSGDSHRNFAWTDKNILEPGFQTQFSTDSILNMIRDGSYQPKFADFLRSQSRKQEAASAGASCFNNNQTKVEHGQFSCIQLFQKELTPSDVGKLNRLVIPKKFAVKYFPYISGNNNNNGEEEEENNNNNNKTMTAQSIDDIELVFYDRLMKCWKFRYCYWRSSQSFVFTRGWNRFVKEKNLKEKDIVTFYACVCPDRVQEGEHFSLIDISYCTGSERSCSVVVDGINQIEEMQKELELKLGQTIRSRILPKDDYVKLGENINGLKSLESNNNNNTKGKGLKLFGVRID
ncbi:AP2/ERF and B3 domain-containing transcription factor At1g50680-like [Mercurialis annua]|uniref:AP2/ERF and B3 domain-containing transcription factor At1g50680-like n=1 Tax=Mercurialis annua TaxID=3986 RepID=UPI00215E30CA|nr:AP2/ERF and B3 domain-containing transcription factor At1g50680-like [Mercurialis annua]